MARQKTRVQQRRVKAKVAQFQPPAAPAKSSGRLQARMLEGHAPSTVFRIALYLGVFQLALLLIGAGLFFVLPDLPLKIEDALVFLLAAIVPGTLIWPALILAWRDRRAQSELIQGQMMGASPVSMTYGLGMLYVKTRQREVQLNIPRKLLRQVPQNQVQVAVRMTPNLRHVSSLQVMGPRLAGSVPTEVPEQFKFAERFPILAIALTYAGVFGIGIILLCIPLPSALLAVHLIVVPIGMAAAALAARYITQWYQKRLEKELAPEA
ncbi:MAG: hypothetical protein M3O87_02300 [Candidatus Dormibacteraeota bacterium]|nr:hypothetical protein [Candidatus Dormibacteraeota bacterium]